MREMRRGDVSYSRSNSIGLEFIAQHHAARDGLEKQEAVRVPYELRWGAVAADLISTNSRQVALLRPRLR